jgi:hypothetical protein
VIALKKIPAAGLVKKPYHVHVERYMTLIRNVFGSVDHPMKYLSVNSKIKDFIISNLFCAEYVDCKTARTAVRFCFR